MSSAYVLVAFAVCILLMILFISKWKIHPVTSILVATIILAISIGTPWDKIEGIINKGMADTLKSIAIVIVLGCILGKVLEETGAAVSITKATVKLFGEKRVLWAILLASAILGIPIWADTVVILLIPIVSNLALQTNKSMMSYGTALYMGALVTASLVPPTPGPVAAAALLVCIGLGLGPVVAVVVVLLAFVTTIMSAQSVGQTGIDPMEIFGLIVLLAVAAFSSASQVQLFYVAGVVAVACGLAGDVMSDFKTGAIIGTSPRAMWVGQAIGALLGTVVAVAVLVTLFSAYGPGAFGSGQMFVSAQASVVATMVSGIPSVSGFVIGLLGGVALYWAGLPAMMFGLGVYLPFYMSLTAALGAGVRWVYERVCAARGIADSEEKGVVVASGVLGGESIVGVVIALSSVLTGLAG